jgi:hypothetical protein
MTLLVLLRFGDEIAISSSRPPARMTGITYAIVVIESDLPSHLTFISIHVRCSISNAFSVI